MGSTAVAFISLVPLTHKAGALRRGRDLRGRGALAVPGLHRNDVLPPHRGPAGLSGNGGTAEGLGRRRRRRSVGDVREEWLRCSLAAAVGVIHRDWAAVSGAGRAATRAGAVAAAGSGGGGGMQFGLKDVTQTRTACSETRTIIALQHHSKAPLERSARPARSRTLSRRLSMPPRLCLPYSLRLSDRVCHRRRGLVGSEHRLELDHRRDRSRRRAVHRGVDHAEQEGEGHYPEQRRDGAGLSDPEPATRRGHKQRSRARELERFRGGSARRGREGSGRTSRTAETVTPATPIFFSGIDSVRPATVISRSPSTWRDTM